MSTESIIAELPPEFVRKMRNWAMAAVGQSFTMLMYSFTSAYTGMLPGGGGGDGVPKLHGESEDVWAGLAKVPPKYRQAVMLFWTDEGRGLRWLGRRLKIDDHTAKARVRKGHELLRVELAVIEGKRISRRHTARLAAGLDSARIPQ